MKLKGNQSKSLKAIFSFPYISKEPPKIIWYLPGTTSTSSIKITSVCLLIDPLKNGTTIWASIRLFNRNPFKKRNSGKTDMFQDLWTNKIQEKTLVTRKISIKAKKIQEKSNFLTGHFPKVIIGIKLKYFLSINLSMASQNVQLSWIRQPRRSGKVEVTTSKTKTCS